MTLLCFITIMCFVVCAMFGRYLAWQNTQQNTQVGRLAIKSTLLGNWRYFLASFHLVQNLPSKCELEASGVRQSKQHYREISVSRVSSALWAENWKIAARLRANAGGGVTRLGQPGQFGRRLQFFFYFSICLQNVSSRQWVKKRRAERTSHWDIFLSSMHYAFSHVNRHFGNS